MKLVGAPYNDRHCDLGQHRISTTPARLASDGFSAFKQRTEQLQEQQPPQPTPRAKLHWLPAPPRKSRKGKGRFLTALRRLLGRHHLAQQTTCASPRCNRDAEPSAQSGLKSLLFSGERTTTPKIRAAHLPRKTAAMIAQMNELYGLYSICTASKCRRILPSFGNER